MSDIENHNIHAESSESCNAPHPDIFKEPGDVKPLEISSELDKTGNEAILKQQFSTKFYDKKNDRVKFPGTDLSMVLVIIILLAILFLAVSIVLLIRNKYDFNYNISMTFLICLLLLLFAFAYHLSPSQEIAVQLPCDSDIIDQSDIIRGKEVYNIGNNLLTFTEAEKVCKAFDGELASLNQMMDAYNKGADWCHYGWLKDRIGVFPTQNTEEARDDLDCGLIGVNGQEFKKLNYPRIEGLDNPSRSYILLGANCYGVKPSEEESQDHDAIINKIRNYDRSINLDKFDKVKNIEILPFNKKIWSL